MIRACNGSVHRLLLKLFPHLDERVEAKKGRNFALLANVMVLEGSKWPH